MRELLVAVFVALLMSGCGGDGKLRSDSSESNQSSAQTPEAKTAQDDKINLDDNETRAKIIAEAIGEGKLQRRGGKYYAPNQQTPYTGWAKRMHDNGQIRWLAQIKDGKTHGLWATWYENGQMRSKRTYKDGKRHGLQTSWHENGQKSLEATYKNGKLHGLWTHWHKNGQKQGEGTYKDGKMHGLGTSWYENGQKQGEGTYKDGERIFKKAWDEDGKLVED